MGFHKRSNSHYHIMTELEALLTGLIIAHSYNLTPIEIETNSVEVIQLLKNMQPPDCSIILFYIAGQH